MNLIKSATLYRTALPGADELREILERHPFTEPSASQSSATGFVNIEATSELVTVFASGYAFALRVDEKIVPSCAVNAEVKKRAIALTEQQGFPPGRKQRSEIKEVVVDEFCAKALVKSSEIVCFYDAREQILIVPTTSTLAADMVIGNLFMAFGGGGDLRMRPFRSGNVLAPGLTTRLNAWITDHDDHGTFGEFYPCDAVALKKTSETVSVKMNQIGSARRGIQEALAAGFTVSQMRFTFRDTYSFSLTSDFRFKSIEAGIFEPMGETPEERFTHEAGIQMLSLIAVVRELGHMFGYLPQLIEDEVAQ